METWQERFLEAEAFFALQDYAAACPLLEKLCDEKPDQEAHYALARVYFRLGLFEEANSILSRVTLSSKMQFLQVENLLAWSQSLTGSEKNRKIAHAKSLLNSLEPNGEVEILVCWNKLAWIHYPSNAEVYFAKVISFYLQPLDQYSDQDQLDIQVQLAMAYLGLGMLANLAGNLPSALNSLQHCLSIRESIAESIEPREIFVVHLELAEVCLNNGDLRQAFLNYLQGLTLLLEYNQKSRFGAVTFEQAIKQTQEMIPFINKAFSCVDPGSVTDLADLWFSFKGSASALDGQLFVIAAKLEQIQKIETLSESEQHLQTALVTYFASARANLPSLEQDYLKLRRLLSAQML